MVELAPGQKAVGINDAENMIKVRAQPAPPPPRLARGFDPRRPPVTMCSLAIGARVVPPPRRVTAPPPRGPRPPPPPSPQELSKHPTERLAYIDAQFAKLTNAIAGNPHSALGALGFTLDVKPVVVHGVCVRVW